MSVFSLDISGRVRRVGAVLAMVLAGCAGASAGESGAENAGFYLYERFDATRNTLGLITRVDSTAGYNFSRYFGVDAGLPLYMVRPSATATAASALPHATGIGNFHITARLTAAGRALTYLGTFTVTAPTGDQNKGLSTGKATYDWNNRLERSFGRFTPFADVGIANTVADTPFFIRPFTSQGLVTHFDGGARVALARKVSAGASLYAIEPSGEQTVISRVRKNAAGTSQMQGASGNAGAHGRQGVFEVDQTAVGPAAIARDRGGSVWLSFGPFRVLDFQVGYNRSATYGLDTVFFGFGVNVGSLIRNGR